MNQPVRKLIVFWICLMTACIVVGLSFPKPQLQVVGRLSGKDSTEIQRLVRRELGIGLLPEFNLWDLTHPGDVIRRLRQYRRERILWAEVKADGSVLVFVGESKAVIRRGGRVFIARKNGKWTLGEYTYWAGSNVLTGDMNVPPDR